MAPLEEEGDAASLPLENKNPAPLICGVSDERQGPWPLPGRRGTARTRYAHSVTSVRRLGGGEAPLEAAMFDLTRPNPGTRDGPGDAARWRGAGIREGGGGAREPVRAPGADDDESTAPRGSRPEVLLSSCGASSALRHPRGR